MKTSFKKLSDSRVELTVTLDAKDLKKAEDIALSRLSKEVKVDGFRKGKVPADIAKKFIPENDLNSSTIDIAVRTTVISAFAENEKSPLVVPSVNVTKYVPGEMAEYTATADIIPDVELGNYKKLGVKLKKTKITNKEVDEMLKNLSKAYAEKKVAKKKAELGDEVVIDFVGKKDGKPFDGGSAKEYHLELGSGSFIPGFEEGIVGHASGDKFDLKLTFPEDYGVKDLAGAKTVFEVLVKQVNEIKLHPIDDTMAAKCGPFKTIDELKKDIETNLTLRTDHAAREKFKDELVKALIEKSKIPTPEILISDQMKAIRDDVERNAASQGLPFEKYLERSGDTLESWEKAARESAIYRVQGSLALQTFAVKEKITVSDEAVAAKIAELKDVYKKSPEALKSLKDPNIKMDIKNRLIIEKALEHLAKINEA